MTNHGGFLSPPTLLSSSIGQTLRNGDNYYFIANSMNIGSVSFPFLVGTILPMFEGESCLAFTRVSYPTGNTYSTGTALY